MEWKELQYALGGACIGVAQDNALWFLWYNCKSISHGKLSDSFPGKMVYLGRAPPIWLLTHLKHSWDTSGSVGCSQACVLNQLTLALVSETPHSMTQDVGIV